MARLAQRDAEGAHAASVAAAGPLQGSGRRSVLRYIFNTAEFLMLTLISLAQAVVAILINARTLRRSIGLGDAH